MSTQEDHGRQPRRYCAYPNHETSSCPPNSAHANCRSGKTASDVPHPPLSDHAPHWGATGGPPPEPPQPPPIAVAPVYGPSKPPRHHQFVDLATNSSAMTPFFALAAERPDDAARPPDPPLFATPQQKPCYTAPHAVAATPSSAMGMTVSPASTADRTAARRGGLGGSLAATPATHWGDRACSNTLQYTPNPCARHTPATNREEQHSHHQHHQQQQQQQQRVRKMQDSAEERRRRRHGEKDEVLTPAATENVTPAKEWYPSAENERRLRSGKEATRRGKKSKNNASTTPQQTSQCHGKNNISRSLLETLAVYSHMDDQEELQQYLVTLRCHGGRSASAFSQLHLSNGTHVLFQGDRGNDLGEVISCEGSTEKFVDEKNTLQHIIRVATEEEVEEWNGTLTEKEAEAAEECRVACNELGLTISVVGAVFQFDRQKLTFMYESDARVDFRALLQVMFSKYHCRIWMERV